MADLSSPRALTNYLVPAIGNIAGIPQALTLTATAQAVDFKSVALNGIPFVPQSVYVDNSAGTGTVIIQSQLLNFNCCAVPPGAVQAVNFPSILNDTYNITGLGNVNFVWTNAPALGAPSEVSASITGTPAVTATITNATLNTTISAKAADGKYFSISGGTTSVNIAPTVQNTNLLKLIMSFSENTTIAAAGINTLTVTQNSGGNTIYKQSVYIPATAAVATFNAKPIELDFSTLAYNMFTSNMTVSLSTALATGILDINAYFG